MRVLYKKQIFEQYKARINNNNLTEALRTGRQTLTLQQFLIDAHQRHQRVMGT